MLYNKNSLIMTAQIALLNKYALVLASDNPVATTYPLASRLINTSRSLPGYYALSDTIEP